MAFSRKPITTALLAAMHQFRSRLAHAEALPQLAIMAVLCGLVTGFIAIGFRLAIEWPLAMNLPQHQSENFEALPPLIRFCLPVIGACLLAILYSVVKGERHRLGVSHVIERYQLHQGHFSARTMLVQFVGGAIALISGHSGGREGPAVHLGAASSSLLARWMKLPNNSVRVLVGCGIAAAIAASFNTPLAGVIFAMEVVMMEYTITGFIPIIIAAVVGSILCHLFFGSEPAFLLPALLAINLWELPWLLLCGVVIGITASLILQANKFLLRLRRYSHWLRFMAVGIATGLAGIAVPEVLGLGYDTVQSALLGQLALGGLLVIVAVKLGLFAITFGLGVPIGGIGPMFFLGACLGAIGGISANMLAPDQASNIGLYVVLGMGGMMAATLNAPLAALVSILELSHNPHTIMPSMLVIVCASLTARLLSRLPGLFLIGHDPKRFASPVMQMLNRHGVTSIMNTHFIEHSSILPWHKAQEFLEKSPQWWVIIDSDCPRYLLRPADVARYIDAQDNTCWAADHPINLLEIPAIRQQLCPLPASATLQEAWVLLKKENANGLYVSKAALPLASDVAGIILKEDIEAFYQV